MAQGASAKAAPRVSAKGRRQKGNRFELEFAKAIGGTRVFGSGKFGHIHASLAEDVQAQNGWRVQCKTLASGWSLLYRWLETAQMLALRANNKPFLVVLSQAEFLELWDAYTKTDRYRRAAERQTGSLGNRGKLSNPGSAAHGPGADA